MRKFVLISAALISVTSPALGSELLTNGNFETGDLSGWAVIDQAGSSGSWFIAGNGAGSPLNGFSTPTLATGGSFNAQTDQGGPGSHQLTQSFNATAGLNYLLSFDAYAIDQSGVAPVGTGLDYTTSPNQHIEVNLAGAAAPIFSGTFGADWAHYSYDLSSLITADGVYTVSFGEVDNQLFYNFGLDNVSLLSSAIPEASTWAMLILGFGLIGGVTRQRQKVTASLTF